MSIEKMILENQSQRAQRLHEDAIVWVMHDHVPVAEDLERMRGGGVTGKMINIGVDVEIGPNVWESGEQLEGWAKKTLIGLDEVLRDLEESGGQAMIVTSAAQIEAAKRNGKIGIMLGVEGGKLLEGDLALLRMFYGKGLRELQLSWAVPNQLKTEAGLTPFGRDVVREMNRLGMLIDLTHLPPTAFDEVIDLSTHPVIVSHGSALGVSNDLTDAQLRGLASTGGMIGIHFYITYMGKRQPDGSYSVDITVADVVDHIDYVRDLVGIDHVGIGADFFPTQGPWAEMQHAQGAYNLKWAIDGMHQMPLITEEMLHRRYSEEEIRKVLGLNFLRVCREVFGE
jgi:membrane dipeptidase